MLARAGAELVLHGHDHADERATLEGPGGAKIPIVGAGSASYAGAVERRSRYNIYEIEGRAITCVTRAHDEAADAFREVRRESLTPSRPPPSTLTLSPLSEEREQDKRLAEGQGGVADDAVAVATGVGARRVADAERVFAPRARAASTATVAGTTPHI